MTEQSIKDEAILKIREAAKLLTKAGIPERFETIVSDEFWMARNVSKPPTCKDDECSYEYFSCCVCDTEDIGFIIKKPKHLNNCYGLEINFNKYYSKHGFIHRLKYAYKTIKAIVFGGIHEEAIYISNDDITRFKEMLGRL